MAGSLSEQDVIDDLKRSLHDAAGAFNAAADDDFRRLLGVALVALQDKRPRTLLGTVTLVADEAAYPLALADFHRYKTHQWGSRPVKPWSPCNPGALPRVTALHDGAAWSLVFDPAPTATHLHVYGSIFRFWYFGRHVLGDDATASTVAPQDRPLLLLRAQAEAMRELSIRGSTKPVSLRDGFSGAPRNSTPSALFETLLREFEDAR